MSKAQGTGQSGAESTVSEDVPASFDTETDVVVIGAGAAGITAGLRALETGAEVLVLERDRQPSGSTALSSGFVPAPGTRFQRAIGVTDSPDAYAADIQHKAANGAEPLITRTVTHAIGPALEWLEDRHGVPWQVLDDFLYPGHSVHRMHAVPERTGTGLVTRLLTAAGTAGLPIATGARVTTLFRTAHQIKGVAVTRPDGQTETIGCRALVLACNGYGGNRDLVAQHVPEIAAAPYHGHAGNTGDAVLWGQALGAATRDLTAYQGHGSLAHPHGILITWALMTEGGIQVNTRGERFANEHRGYSEHAVDVLAQPCGAAWAIYDKRLHDFAMGFPDYAQAVVAGARKTGTPEELAAKIDVPADALAETIRTTQACAAGERADPLGRDFTQKPPLGEALSAIRVTGALFHTQGGLVVGTDARVRRADGAPFPNLFAAGGAACGVSGARVEGYLSGNGLLTAIGLGYVGGDAAG
ncbi:MAG: FAD-dependent oxidoreductase [Pseudomonadota bacterium]